MSIRSIAAYFPWRRVKVVCHNVVQASRSALVRLEPDERFHPRCHACGRPARTVHSQARKFVRDLSVGDCEIAVHKGHHYMTVALDHDTGRVIRMESSVLGGQTGRRKRHWYSKVSMQCNYYRTERPRSPTKKPLTRKTVNSYRPNLKTFG